MEGRLDAHQARQAHPEIRVADEAAAQHFRQPRSAHGVGLLRPVELRVRQPAVRPAHRHHPGGAAQVADHRRGHPGDLGRQLGRRPGFGPGAGGPRPAAEPAVRAGETRVRADLHVLPAAHLRALPQPLVRGLVPLRRDLQARRGRHRARRPGRLPRLAPVRHRLPVQEDLLQPQDRQGREVHLLLPAGGGRHPDGVLGDLRGQVALHRRDALRRGQGARGRLRHRHRRPVPGAAGCVPQPARPARDRRGGAGRYLTGLASGRAGFAGLPGGRAHRDRP
ncbi:Uncharacterised protein [Mycobacteroides abscessus subsp. abscessus]|nr:Uncharacterised protein [Mycobacteroides abscessus subsp. abscessus]